MERVHSEDDQELARLIDEQRQDMGYRILPSSRIAFSLNAGYEDAVGTGDSYLAERMAQIAERMPSPSTATPAAERVRRAVEQEIELQAKIDADEASEPKRYTEPAWVVSDSPRCPAISGYSVWDRPTLIASRHPFWEEPYFRQAYGNKWRRPSLKKRGPKANGTDFSSELTLKIARCMSGNRSVDDFAAIARRRGPVPTADRSWKVMLALTVQMFLESGFSTQTIATATGLSKQRISDLAQFELPALSTTTALILERDQASGVPVPRGTDAPGGRSDDRPLRPSFHTIQIAADSMRSEIST